MRERWTNVCVVGIGGHARTKLIPAIVANGQAIVGLVSRQSAEALPPYPLFATVDEAIAGTPDDTLFVLASPPAVHFAQAMRVLAAGRDVMIEKPAVLIEREAVALAAAAGEAVVVEAFMHRHTRLYAAFRERFAAGRAEMLAIDFRVPALPTGTFRQERGMAWTCLYDIGCYAVSLIGDLGLPLGDLAIERAGEGRVRFGGTVDGMRVVADVGIGPDYVNAVTLVAADRIVFAPFFYGRPGARTIVGAAGTTTIDEIDAFRAMLATPSAIWLRDQPERLARMVAASACLERLAAALG